MLNESSPIVQGQLGQGRFDEGESVSLQTPSPKGSTKLGNRDPSQRGEKREGGRKNYPSRDLNNN